MDIYRFFQPQHNPRLLSSPLRQQEIGELEQVTSELLRAVKRACQRTVKHNVGDIGPEDFADLIQALQYCSAALAKICDKHPGDSVEDLEDLISERSDSPDWSNWARLVQEQIALGGALADNRLLLEKRSINNSIDEQSIRDFNQIKDIKNQATSMIATANVDDSEIAA